MQSRILGIGHSLPKYVCTNQELSKIVDTSDEWIIQRTGISERRIISNGETIQTLALDAAQKALKNAGKDSKDLEMIICATVGDEKRIPSLACIVQDGLKASGGAFDVNAACSGFIYGLNLLDALIKTKQVKNGLVIGVDTLSDLVDWSDRTTCVLFGDGAGAAYVEGMEQPNQGILSNVLMADGKGQIHFYMKEGGVKHPSLGEKNPLQTMVMNGGEVYKFAQRAFYDACIQVTQKAGVSINDVDLIVPHQANIRIIHSAAEKMNFPIEKIFVNIDRLGNTSAASVPIALSEAVEEGKIVPETLVLTVGFGAGLTWGANLIRW